MSTERLRQPTGHHRSRAPHRSLTVICLFLGVTVLDGAITASRAQSLRMSGLAEPQQTGQLPGQPDRALPLGDWLVYPKATLGTMFDSNPTQSSVGAHSSFGFEIAPSLLAEHNTGINKITLFGTADGRIYTSTTSSNADDVTAHAGALDVYSPRPDLTVRSQFDYLRQKDFLSNLSTNYGLTSLNPTGVGLAPTVNPQSYNQLAGNLSIQKNFAEFFGVLSGSVVSQTYDRTSGTTAPSPNGIVYTGSGRLGIWATPAFYTYIQVSADSRVYSDNLLSSSGYRVLAGVGSDRIGFFRGELYLGYQSETYNSGSIGAVSAPAFGGRIEYYPLPDLTFRATLDESLGASLLTASGTATRVTSMLLDATYAPVQEWSVSARGGYVHTEYVDNPRRDNGWVVGFTVDYNFWRQVGLALNYQHLETSSNVPLAGFSRDVATLGLTYRY